MKIAKDERFMRLFVFFDLPVTTKDERRVATKFRTYLLKSGYDMLQFSVYCRICKGQDVVNRELSRLKGAIPSKGNVRLLQITDLQYAKMKLLVGMPKKIEKIGAKQLVLF